MEKPKRRWSCVVAALVLFSACQEYGFEELPSSVIKEKRWETTVTISASADILFVIDNSGSMVGEQIQLGQSFRYFLEGDTDNDIPGVEDAFGDDYHIAVITTGVKSDGCPSCVESGWPSSCVNETGESGRFQARIGKNEGTVVEPNFTFLSPGDAGYPPECGEIITSSNKNCFYDAAQERGIALVGTNGCGYEKGFQPILQALDDLKSVQPDFLRPNATLAIILVSDEEDCGSVGDVAERTSAGGLTCYFAAAGHDDQGRTSDETGRPYELTSVDEFYNRLIGLKGGEAGMVKFAAIVGVSDPANPDDTKIEFYQHPFYERADVRPACETPGCKSQCTPFENVNQAKYVACLEACEAKPGTRYIEMARKFGQNGFIDTICQADFAETMAKVGEFVGCPKVFKLQEPILHPDLANILINGEEVPRFSCGFSEVRLVECSGPSDTSCPDSAPCIETWTYHPPDGSPDAPGGTITFAPHYDPCEFFQPGESVHIELVYATP